MNLVHRFKSRSFGIYLEFTGEEFGRIINKSCETDGGGSRVPLKKNMCHTSNWFQSRTYGIYLEFTGN